MHPMRASELRDRTPFPQVRLNEIPANVHRRLPPRCRRCLDTSLADVLNSDTAEGALSRAHVVPCALNAARGIGRPENNLRAAQLPAAQARPASAAAS